MSKEQKPQQPAPRTATQRLDDLERGLMSLYHTADNMARDLGIIKDAIKLLGNKLDSVVKISGRGEALSDETIAKQMVENNIVELRTKVEDLVKAGNLAPTDVVGPQSFVVGRELAEDGTIPNPRMQFMVSALNPAVKDKFPGAKVGDILNLQDGKWTFEVQEIYSIQVPKAPEAVVEAAPAPTDEGVVEQTAGLAATPEGTDQAQATGEGQDQSPAAADGSKA